MRELGQEQFCLIQIPRQGVLLAPELSLSMHRQGGESQLHSLRRVSSGPICPEGLMATPGTCAAQLEPREGQAEPRVCKEKVVTLFTQETWGVWVSLNLDNKQKALPALELLLLLYMGRESN